MPQLDITTYTSQLFWLFITFSFMYVLLVKFALPNIRELLQARQDRISKDFEKSEKATLEAEAVRQEYTKALEKTHSEALQLIQKSLDSAKADIHSRQQALEERLNNKIAQAEHDLEKQTLLFRQDLEELSLELSQTLLEKLAQKSVSTETLLQTLQTIRQK